MKLSRRNFVKTGLIYVPWLVLPHDRVNCSGFLPRPTLLGETYRWAYGRVPLNGAVLSGRTIVAADNFGVNWLRYGIRSKTKRLNLYCGTNLASCFSPYISDVGVSVYDTNNNFDAADYSEATGLTGNGTDEFLSTTMDPAAAATTNDVHMGCYVRSKTTDVGVIMGTVTGGTNELSWLIGYSPTNVTTFALYAEVGPPFFDDSASGVGHYVCTRTASNLAKGYKNGVEIMTTATPGGTGFPTPTSLYVHAWNDSVTGAAAFTSRTIAGYHFGTGFTAQNALDAYKCFDQFNRALGRAV